jgi:hypothetical protein
MDEKLIVVTQAVKQIEDRIAARFFGVVAWGKEYAVGNGARENFA